MRIGMVCYASLGGSGVVATELARALAERGHSVHLISSELPSDGSRGVTGSAFHPVVVPSYPLFREPQYLLALVEHHRPRRGGTASSTSSTRTMPCRMPLLPTWQIRC